jgi:hypothetical protein
MPTFRYLDSTQKATIIGKDTIGVYGGKLEVILAFNWTENNLVVPQTGTAVARILSEEIMFSKMLVMEQGYLDYNLSFCYNVSFFNNNFSLLRVDPPTTSDLIKTAILTALNNAGQNVSVKPAL